MWEVEGQIGFRGDMTLLSGVSSALVASCFAQRYWAGLGHPSGGRWWELLLIPPVTVRGVA